MKNYGSYLDKRHIKNREYKEANIRFEIQAYSFYGAFIDMPEEEIYSIRNQSVKRTEVNRSKSSHYD